MNNVISLSDAKDARAEDSPHLAGEARCIACRHRWAAVAPTGTIWLDCPACSLPKGAFVHPCFPSDGGYLWQCNCGCDIFHIIPAGARCCQCGATQSGY